jgi:hypothetical protein
VIVGVLMAAVLVVFIVVARRRRREGKAQLSGDDPRVYDVAGLYRVRPHRGWYL